MNEEFEQGRLAGLEQAARANETAARLIRARATHLDITAAVALEAVALKIRDFKTPEPAVRRIRK